MLLFSCCFTDHSNELLIGWSLNQHMAIQSRRDIFELLLNGGYEMAALISGWRKHCFTFKAGSQIKVDNYILSKIITTLSIVDKLYLCFNISLSTAQNLIER